jgi:hypothetical protein
MKQRKDIVKYSFVNRTIKNWNQLYLQKGWGLSHVDLIFLETELGKQLTAIGLSPVAVIQYAFTHKQYTEQYNETEQGEVEGIEVRRKSSKKLQ